jgi:signal peptidase I
VVTIGAVTYFVGRVSHNVGPSMEPTLATEGETTLLDRFSHVILQQPYRKGDVVVSVCPLTQSKVVCKRILAVEGDVVVQEQLFGPPTFVVVPPGQVYLKGDNPYQSRGTTC